MVTNLEKSVIKREIRFIDKTIKGIKNDLMSKDLNPRMREALKIEMREQLRLKNSLQKELRR